MKQLDKQSDNRLKKTANILRKYSIKHAKGISRAMSKERLGQYTQKNQSYDGCSRKKVPKNEKITIVYRVKEINKLLNGQF